MSTAYQNEIVSPAADTTVNAKIGLMYVSDYGYAASPTYWTYPGYASSYFSKDYRTAIGENWMYMGLKEWTIVSNVDDAEYVFYIDSLGFVFSDLVANSIFGVRPVFYLNSDVTYVSGSGTKEDSIRIN